MKLGKRNDLLETKAREKRASDIAFAPERPAAQRLFDIRHTQTRRTEAGADGLFQPQVLLRVTLRGEAFTFC
jgi:hypothetical protein